MPIILEGEVGYGEMPDGRKAVVVLPAPGLVYIVPLTQEQIDLVVLQLKGSGLVAPPPGYQPPRMPEEG